VMAQRQDLVHELGLSRPKSELLSRLGRRVRVGERYSRRNVDEETRRLYNLGNFQRVLRPLISDFEDGVAILFRVEEKPYVKRVRFIGRQSLKRRDLVEDDPPLLTRENDLFNPYWVRQDERALQEKYLKAGFLFATVRREVTELESGSMNVVFRISEGTRVRIRNVRFTGNRSLESSELLALMQTRERDFWFFGLLRPGFFNHEHLQQDIISLKRYYRRFGFFDVRIEPEKLELSGDKRHLDVTLRVDEGPVYVFKGYRFAGNAVFTSDTLLDLTLAQPGKPFSMEQLERDQDKILKYYGDRAYIFADILPKLEYTEERAEVFVRLDIAEENEIYIEQVRIQGNLKTQDRVIRRELEFYPGEKVDQSKLIKSRSNLARLGLFRDISYTYEGTGSRRDVVVHMDEDTSGQLIVGFGVTSGFGIIGNFTITKRNFDLSDWPESCYEVPDRFTGAGQTLHLQAQPGTRRSLYRLTFVEPYLFDTRNALTLSASSLELIREDWDEDRATFAPSVAHSFDFDRDFRVSVGLRLENVEVDSLEPDAPQVVVASRGHSVVVAVNTDLSLNKILFEPLEGPYDGHRESIFYEYAGGALGGDVDFHKIEARSEFYFPLYVHERGNLHHVIGMQNNFGWIEAHDRDD
ncbi:MAG: outer membrane protein assembly factor BamA, partial [Planctomycetota bacterium]